MTEQPAPGLPRLPWALLGALAGLGCAEQRAPRTVWLVSLDTARADAVNFAEASLTPRLSQLAARGQVFEQALTGTSWTLPSHVQMFTGQPPALHGVQDDNVVIDERTPTLPELLSDEGFLTVGVYSGPYLGSIFGFGRGFDAYWNAMEGGAELEARFRTAVQRGDRQAPVLWGVADLQSHRDVTSPRIVEQAREGIDTARGRDLFLFTHFFDPHYDYQPPSPYDRRFDPDYEGTIDGRDFFQRRFEDGRPLPLDPRDLQHIQALYLGELSWTDEHVGQIAESLANAERLDGAWIAVVGDHGEEFFEHGSWGHRQTLYDEQLRIPFLLVPPVDAGFEPGRNRELVSLSDLLPTVLEALGLPASEHVRGRSLLPVLRGETLEERPVLSSLRSRPFIQDEVIKHRLTDSLRSSTSKLVRELSLRNGEVRLADLRYYDLEQDPGELRPLRDLQDPRVRAAWAALEAEYADLRARRGALPTSPDAERRSDAADMMHGMLAQLGYRDGEPDEAIDPALELPWGLAPLPALDLDQLPKVGPGGE
jgi:arylsulfatase A-like enzyme